MHYPIVTALADRARRHDHADRNRRNREAYERRRDQLLAYHGATLDVFRAFRPPLRQDVIPNRRLVEQDGVWHLRNVLPLECQ